MTWRSWRSTGWVCGCWLAASVTLAAPPGTITPIHRIQGAGPASPLVGRTVTTRGVVTAVFPGLRGWFLQDETGDGDPRTSDGIFVFANRGPIDVAVGERIELTATVSEYAARAGGPTQTELVRPSVVARLGTGRVAPTPVALPEAVDGDLERGGPVSVRLRDGARPRHPILGGLEASLATSSPVDLAAEGVDQQVGVGRLRAGAGDDRERRERNEDRPGRAGEAARERERGAQAREGAGTRDDGDPVEVPGRDAGGGEEGGDRGRERFGPFLRQLDRPRLRTVDDEGERGARGRRVDGEEPHRRRGDRSRRGARRPRARRDPSC